MDNNKAVEQDSTRRPRKRGEMKEFVISCAEHNSRDICRFFGGITRYNSWKFNNCYVWWIERELRMTLSGSFYYQLTLFRERLTLSESEASDE